jgi:hypothetical protein
MKTFTFFIYRDEELIKTFENQTTDAQVFGYLLRNQGQSVHWALKHGGYKVTYQDDETKELFNY